MYNKFNSNLDKVHWQVITAEDFSLNIPNNILTVAEFGFSLSGGHDVDDNGQPDVLIGAPGIHSAFLLR